MPEHPEWVVRWADQPEPARRVEVEIDGIAAFVSCDQPILRNRPEAWGTALALPAARTGTALRFDAPVDPTWLAGAQRNVAAAAEWWGGEPTLEVRAAEPTPASASWWRRKRRQDATSDPEAKRPPLEDQRGRALCFTGGVDSFYSLLCCDHRPTHLLYVHGFDVDLDDTERRAAISTSIGEVAEARGLQAIELATDLRQHPRFDAVSWEHTHGAALACMALLAADVLEAMIVPPSYTVARMIPWGSRPDLDVHWSVPGVLGVEHGDASLHRLGRTTAIAHEPLAQQHLRVCWEHRNPGVNCGRCEKCARTMTTLCMLGVLDECATFPGTGHLAEAIDGIDDLNPGLHRLWGDLVGGGLPPEIEAAVGRMLDRTAP
jgi:hypothetical protein